MLTYTDALLLTIAIVFLRLLYVYGPAVMNWWGGRYE